MPLLPYVLVPKFTACLMVFVGNQTVKEFLNSSQTLFSVDAYARLGTIFVDDERKYDGRDVIIMHDGVDELYLLVFIPYHISLIFCVEVDLICSNHVVHLNSGIQSSSMWS